MYRLLTLPHAYVPFREGLIGLLALKTILHLTAILNGYGPHRDEYLYLAEGHHPLWGYMEGPPVIGWVAGISQFIFGGTVWAAKIPVLIIGLLSLWLLCELVRELGGGKHASSLPGQAGCFPLFTWAPTLCFSR